MHSIASISAHYSIPLYYKDKIRSIWLGVSVLNLFVCLSVCLSICLSVYLSVCLSVCLSVSQPASQPACLPACVWGVCVCVCVFPKFFDTDLKIQQLLCFICHWTTVLTIDFRSLSRAKHRSHCSLTSLYWRSLPKVKYVGGKNVKFDFFLNFLPHGKINFSV